MEGLILHLSQRNSRKLHNENVAVQDLNRSFFHQSYMLDLNGTTQQEPATHPDYNPLRTFDMNGATQEQLEEQHTVLRDAKFDSLSSHEPCSISKDDIEKIQVDCLSATALQLLLKLKRHLKIALISNEDVELLKEMEIFLFIFTQNPFLPVRHLFKP